MLFCNLFEALPPPSPPPPPSSTAAIATRTIATIAHAAAATPCYQLFTTNSGQFSRSRRPKKSQRSKSLATKAAACTYLPGHMRALGDPPPPCPASTTFSNCRLLGSAADACDYRGNVSITKSGLTCQLWSEHVPHNHTHVTEEVYPAAGIEEHNFCRNPDRSEPTAWCYTTDPDVRWEERDLAAVRNLLSPFSDAGPRPTLGALGAFSEAAIHDSVRSYARKTSPPPQNCDLR